MSIGDHATMIRRSRLQLFLVVALLAMGSDAQESLASATSTRPMQSSITQSITTSYVSTTAPASITATSSQASSSSSGSSADGNNGQGSMDREEGVFNYYWLLLAAFGILLAVIMWWAHRQRRKRKELMRRSGQNALARDMEGWINTRRWFHGSGRMNMTRAFVRREEGLNEHGEAPPPYQPKSNVTVAQDPPHDLANGPTIPLRTLSRDVLDTGLPPEYRETAAQQDASTQQAHTANTGTSRSVTTNSPSSLSAGNLVPGQGTSITSI